MDAACISLFCVFLDFAGVATVRAGCLCLKTSKVTLTLDCAEKTVREKKSVFFRAVCEKLYVCHPSGPHPSVSPNPSVRG